MTELILGSQSPRRSEILHFFSIPFHQVSPDFDEKLVSFTGDPSSFACEVAERKALSLSGHLPGKTILTADTVVYREGRLYMKPESPEEAFSMLRELAGKEHSVFTGVCTTKGNHRYLEAEETRVFFHELTDAQIHAYHRHYTPFDKAGAYAIQKGGSVIVKRIEGCYYNIMGLPLNTTRHLLSKVGIELWDHLKPL